MAHWLSLLFYRPRKCDEHDVEDLKRGLSTAVRMITKALLETERRLMASLEELNSALDDVKAGLSAHADKLAEIGLDLDDLIAKLSSGGVDQAALDAAVAKAQELKASVQSESDTLDALRSKHETA